jgi:hypothetical protein
MRRSSRSPEAGSYIATPGPMSCIRSLSAETISTSAPRARAWRRVGRDQVVGLVAVLLDRRQAEGAHGVAHQRKLRHEIFGRIGPMRLVGGIELAAERILRLVENDREMGRRDPRRAIAQELQHLGREQPHRADRQPVGAIIVFLHPGGSTGNRRERRTTSHRRGKIWSPGPTGRDGLSHGASLNKAGGRSYRFAQMIGRSDAQRVAVAFHPAAASTARRKAPSIVTAKL